MRVFKESWPISLTNPSPERQPSLEGMRRVAVPPYYLSQDEEIVVVGIRHAVRNPSSMPDQE
ncbi:hypothetical protein ABK249_24155 [Neorhizobium sp. Rsf11]|uniref:Type II toxin-antitoxin system RelE/ParE family toxin n=1 Tax=Neorhizobium phenanthreniclasticum TaxID=3157917 RepID=A0ABV0M820_9HYPH